MRNYRGPIPALCRERWGEDHINTLACAEAQQSGRLFVLRLSTDPEYESVIDSCRMRNPGDDELIGYCVWLVFEAR